MEYKDKMMMSTLLILSNLLERNPQEAIRLLGVAIREFDKVGQKDNDIRNMFFSLREVVGKDTTNAMDVVEDIKELVYN